MALTLHSIFGGRSRPSARPQLGRLFAATGLSLTFLAAPTSAVRGGQIDPSVQVMLASLSPDEQATVLFVFERQVDLPALDLALKFRRATRRERHRRVVEALQAAAGESQAPFLTELELRRHLGDVAGYTSYWISNLVIVRGTRATIEELSGRPDIQSVEPNFRAFPLEPAHGLPASAGARGIGVPPGIRAINADRVWYELGVNGAGTIVAILDSGVDASHPALHDGWRGNNGHLWWECWHDVLGWGTQVPTDPAGHGTHVMGTLTGLGAATEDTIGVAWGAQWIAANAINEGVGPEFDNDIIDCFQWFLDPDGNPNTVDDVPDVIQNSWGVSEQFGGSPPYIDCDPRWWPIIDACEAAGIVTTWSVGGDGPAPGTIRSPADRATSATNAFAVGAVDASNYGFPYPIAPWSGRGPSGCNAPAPFKIKPEVVAPGVDIYSSVPGGGYAVWSGSSFAGPHVAGVVALLRSAEPDMDVDTIKEILMLTARDEGPSGEDNTYGWGTIDAYQAVRNYTNVSSPPQQIDRKTRLFASRPNPFSRETILRFQLLDDGPASLVIYDPGGRQVRTLLSTLLPHGEHTAIWDGRDQSGRPVPAGVYFSRLNAREFVGRRTMVMTR